MLRINLSSLHLHIKYFANWSIFLVSRLHFLMDILFCKFMSKTSQIIWVWLHTFYPGFLSKYKQNQTHNANSCPSALFALTPILQIQAITAWHYLLCSLEISPCRVTVTLITEARHFDNLGKRRAQDLERRVSWRMKSSQVLQLLWSTWKERLSSYVPFSLSWVVRGRI